MDFYRKDVVSTIENFRAVPKNILAEEVGDAENEKLCVENRRDFLVLLLVIY